ncbi:MAG: hypothetical protein QNK04_33935 [Myxococcota bacterium]|nr:hypothetical protein [Myxococcota bacterium]
MRETRAEPGAPAPLRAWRALRRHPVMVGIVLAGAVAGGVLAVVYELGDFTPTGRALAGAFAGAWFAMFPLGFRMFE